MTKLMNSILIGMLGAVALFTGSAGAGTVTYYHNDLAGSPVAATNTAGAVIWRESYRPYGERLTNAPAATGNKVWFTSRHQDPGTGLVYMGARYYDPVVGRFVSMDPAGFDETNLHSHNRYAYANNNPHKFVDPDGATAIHLARAVGQGSFTLATRLGARELGERIGLGIWVLMNASSDTVDTAKDKGQGKATGNAERGENTNPYAGPVDRPVIVVDPSGNAIPVGQGEKVTSSPNGDYQQVRDKDGKETGVRLDRGGHKTHSDPSSRNPHAHVPGVTQPDGNPHLPIQ